MKIGIAAYKAKPSPQCSLKSMAGSRLMAIAAVIKSATIGPNGNHLAL